MRALDPEGASVILVFRLKDEAGGEGPPLAAPARGSGARQEGDVPSGAECYLGAICLSPKGRG